MVFLVTIYIYIYYEIVHKSTKSCLLAYINQFKIFTRRCSMSDQMTLIVNAVTVADVDNPNWRHRCHHYHNYR